MHAGSSTACCVHLTEDCFSFSKQVKVGRGSSRVYTFKEATIRIHEEHLQQVASAEGTSEVQFYILGDLLMIITSQDCIDMILTCMHACVKLNCLTV